MTGDGTLPCGGNLFLDYVCTLSNAEKGYLYSQPACGKPYLSFHLVLLTDFEKISTMVQQTSSTELETAQKLLRNLGLLTSSDKLHPVFRQSYLRSIMLGSQKCAKINSVEVDVKRRQNEKELGKKAAERWECILRYLALPSDKNMS
ncbi:hypothetical protein OSTOST_13054, partial [Ostertagia ostertagi]